MMSNLSRRTLIQATGAVGASILPTGFASNETPAQEPHRVPATATAPGAQPTTYLFFNAEEAAFIEAAVARLIPADDKWPGALEAGVPNYIDKQYYIDRQLNGAWGAGERLYRSGPSQAGRPSQGYQLPFTPAELFRTAIAAINNELKAKTPFAKRGELQMCKRGLRKSSPDSMALVAKQLYDREIAAVAAFYQQIRGSPDVAAAK
jgi:gluconate 2-dehydrogenase gamma chain